MNCGISCLIASAASSLHSAACWNIARIRYTSCILAVMIHSPSPARVTCRITLRLLLHRSAHTEIHSRHCHRKERCICRQSCFPWRSEADTTRSDTVKRIGVKAFRCCTQLAIPSVTETLTDIAFYTFADCAAPTSVTIPADMAQFCFYLCP